MAACLCLPAKVAAQDFGCISPNGCPAWWASELAVAGGNVLLGGLTAGLWQELRGGSFRDGFTRGALGGGLGYAGKRISSARLPVAGLLGREVAAVGHSIVRNAAEGRGTLSRVALPLLFLPARLQLGDWGAQAPVRLDAISLWYFANGVVQSHVALDLGRSLSYGEAVFVSEDRLFKLGDGTTSVYTAGGALFITRAALDAPSAPLVVAHERVHQPQIDFLLLTLGDAGDTWLATRVPGMRSLSRYLATNLVGFGLIAPQQWLQAGVAYDRLPWELEAMVLVRDVN